MPRRSSTVSTSTSSTTPTRSARSRPAATRSQPRRRCTPRTRTAPALPTCVLASVPPELAEHLSAVWEAPLRAAGADRADVFHLHHLTPQLDAAHRRWPHVPLVVHLHGTELKLIEAIEERVALAAALGETLASMPAAAAKVADRAHRLDAAQVEMLRTTRWDVLASRRVLGGASEATGATRRPPHHRVTAEPRCRDLDARDRPRARHRHPERGGHRALPAHGRARRGARRAAFRRALVEDPQGWTESGPPGTLAYTEADLDRLLGADDDATVLLYVGRFLGFKRVPALIRAFARAREPVHAAGLAGDLGWPSRRVGRRAPRHGGRRGRGRRHLLRGLARPRRPARRAGRVRRAGRPVGRGPVPPGSARGDGGRPSRPRLPQRRPRVDGQPRPGASHRLARPAGRSRRPHRCAHDRRERPRRDHRTGRQRAGPRPRRTVMGRARQPLRGDLRPRHRTPPHPPACRCDRRAQNRS